MPTADANRGRALGRGLDVLEALARAGGPVTLADLAQQTFLPKPTVHRVLQTLQERGYAWQGDHQQYLPGYRIRALAERMQDSAAYVQMARPVMAALQEAVPETIHLAVLEGDVALYAEKLEARRPYRMASAVGSPFDLHSSSMGKAILAFLPGAESEEWIRRLELRRYTSSTLTDVAALRAALDTVRDRGFALDDEEDEDEVRCVGAAVLDHRVRPIGGICVSAPTFQLSLDEAVALGPRVLAAARDISLALGARRTDLPPVYQTAAVASASAEEMARPE